MSAGEVNFTFNGLHCLRDFGCIYIADKTRIISGKTERSEYSIAGVSGTILMGDKAIRQPYNLTGTLVPMKTPQSLQACQQLARDIAAWLLAGRCKLSWDYDPLHQFDAEVVDAIKWDTKAWFEGGITVTFQVQPYARDLVPATASANMPSGVNTLLVPVSTVDPAPVSVEINNTGSTAITGVRISDPDGHSVTLSKGMSLAAGDVLKIDMEPPIGATIISGETTTSALRYAEVFDQLTLREPDYLTVTLTGGSAWVTATAWGCKP